MEWYRQTTTVIISEEPVSMPPRSPQIPHAVTCKNPSFCCDIIGCNNGNFISDVLFAQYRGSQAGDNILQVSGTISVLLVSNKPLENSRLSGQLSLPATLCCVCSIDTRWNDSVTSYWRHVMDKLSAAHHESVSDLYNVRARAGDRAPHYC